jgi:hypothetical protein
MKNPTRINLPEAKEKKNPVRKSPVKLPKLPKPASSALSTGSSKKASQKKTLKIGSKAAAEWMAASAGGVQSARSNQKLQGEI